MLGGKLARNAGEFKVPKGFCDDRPNRPNKNCLGKTGRNLDDFLCKQDAFAVKLRVNPQRFSAMICCGNLVHLSRSEEQCQVSMIAFPAQIAANAALELYCLEKLDRNLRHITLIEPD